MDRFGGRTRTRTLDPLIKSQLLYQLSYAPGTNDRRCSSHIGRAVASHTSSGMFGYPDFFLSKTPLDSKRRMRLHPGSQLWDQKDYRPMGARGQRLHPAVQSVGHGDDTSHAGQCSRQIGWRARHQAMARRPLLCGAASRQHRRQGRNPGRNPGMRRYLVTTPAPASNPHWVEHAMSTHQWH